MDRDCGWVEVLPLEADTVLARGRLLISDSADQSGVQAAQVLQPSVPSPNEPALVEWTGRLETLRVDAELPADRPYRLRFESNDEVRDVLLEAVDTAEDGGTATVRSRDGQLPAVWFELGGH